MKALVLTMSILLSAACLHAHPLIIGHRGTPIYAPENTTVALQMAWDLGADGIECDIYVTNDKRLVLLHDKTTSRTGQGVNLNVKNTPSDELVKVDVGAFKHDAFKGIRIPYIEEAFTYHPEGGIFVIEVKDEPDTIAPLKKAIEATGRPWKDFNIISFNFDTCVEARKLMPEIEVYFLKGARDRQTREIKNFTPKILERAKAANLTGVDLDYKGVTEELVKQCHEMGMKFYVWTVNEEADVKRMARFGVDSITTDRPDMARRWVEQELNIKTTPTTRR